MATERVIGNGTSSNPRNLTPLVIPSLPPQAAQGRTSSIAPLVVSTPVGPPAGSPPQPQPLPGVMAPPLPPTHPNTEKHAQPKEIAKVAKADPLEEGKEFNGYIIGPVLGAGAGGLVRVATNPGTGEQVAIKVMSKALAKSRHHIRTMERESQIHAFLDHPHIVPMVEVFEDENYIYIATEYMAGGSFLGWLRSQQKNLEVRQRAFPIFYQLVSALRFLHACRVVHRDVKPENMLMSKDGHTLKLADFGLSNIMPNEAGTKMKTSCGSPYYCAPEILQGKPYEPRKVDVWGAGVVFHAMVLGCVPFYRTDMRETINLITSQDWLVPNTCESRCRDLLQKMLTRDPDQRISLDDIVTHNYWTTQCKKYGYNSTGDHDGASGCVLWREDKSTWKSGDPQVRPGAPLDSHVLPMDDVEFETSSSSTSLKLRRSGSEYLGDGLDRILSGSALPSCDECVSGTGMRVVYSSRLNRSSSRPAGLRATRVNGSNQSLVSPASANSLFSGVAFSPPMSPNTSPPNTAPSRGGATGRYSPTPTPITGGLQPITQPSSCAEQQQQQQQPSTPTHTHTQLTRPAEHKSGKFSKLLNWLKPQSKQRKSSTAAAPSTNARRSSKRGKGNKVAPMSPISPSVVEVKGSDQ